MERIYSVSYTHLEYAKKGKDTTIDSLNEAKEILSELNEEIKGSFRAVSYTHLDVYKRQSISWNKKQSDCSSRSGSWKREKENRHL